LRVPRVMDAWPPLPFDAWRDTHATLHRWLQIVGKLRVAQSPWVNHSWHVSLHVTARGLSTLTIPHGSRTFQVDVDFIDHRMWVHTDEGRSKSIGLEPQSVAELHGRLMGALGELGVPVAIHGKPNELEEAVPFPEDRAHRSYDAEYANRFWRVLVQCQRVLETFRARFVGKSSPVHFFWGNMDIALTRFSGRQAPRHPGGRPNLPDRVLRDAYFHECSECGFWPGGDEHPDPVFYSLAYPEPAGFRTAGVAPDVARYSTQLGEFVLPYENVRRAPDPDARALEFLQSAYEAAANRGGWDRAALEYPLRPERRDRARTARSG
jgi:hypothetical protein